MVGLAVGDALGAHLEAHPLRDGESLAAWIERSPSPLPRSRDAAMAVATARSLIDAGGFRDDHMEATLDAAFGAADGDEPGDADDNAAAFGNGAALRAPPIGLLFHRSPGAAANVAARAAWMTHAHPLGVDGAALQASAVAELVNAGGIDPAALLQRLRQRVRTRWFREQLERWDALSGSVATTARVLGNSVEAHRSVPTAVYCCLQNPGSFTDAVLFALSLGGDTSALGAMTGALAGARHGASAIPASWRDRLERPAELTELADGLLRLAAP